MASSPSNVPRGVVLVADDDPVMRMLMLEMLSQVGLDGIEAADAGRLVRPVDHHIEPLGVGVDTVDEEARATHAALHALTAMSIAAARTGLAQLAPAG